MKRKIASSIVALLLGVVLAVPVGATVFNFQAVIDGAQANAGAGTGSPATGSATVLFDDVTNLLSWNISWSGLLGTLSVAHFHGPAPAGVSAGVQVNFLGIAPGPPSIGSTTITPAQGTDLVNGLWYINIHSSAFPPGEIRGQVLRVPVPEPASLLVFLTGLVGLGALRRRRT